MHACMHVMCDESSECKLVARSSVFHFRYMGCSIPLSVSEREQTPTLYGDGMSRVEITHDLSYLDRLREHLHTRP